MHHEGLIEHGAHPNTTTLNATSNKKDNIIQVIIVQPPQHPLYKHGLKVVLSVGDLILQMYGEYWPDAFNIKELNNIHDEYWTYMQQFKKSFEI